MDVIGKGADADLSAGVASKNIPKLEEWEAWTAQVDAAVASNDSKPLERLLLTTLQPKKERRDGKRVIAGIKVNDDEPDFERDLATFDASRVDRKQIHYVLSKAFQARSDADTERKQSSRFTTTSRSRKIYRWFALAGYLTLSHLRQATAHHGANLQRGDIAIAIADFDGTFELMHDLLDVRASWELPELVQALRSLLLSLSTRPTGAALKALPAPPQANGDIEMVNGDAESHVESESALAERELDVALAALSNGLELRSETLRLILDRLTAYPQASVTATMRAMMKHEELFFFMKILRIELLEGGWHQKYVYTAKDKEEADSMHDSAFEREADAEEPRNQAIGEISLLMSCAVDAVGLSGWLVGQSADVEGTFGFMEGLKDEVGASAEGLFEYDAMTLFLGEVERLRYGVEKAGQAKRQRKRVEAEEWDLKGEERLLPMVSEGEWDGREG